MPMTPEVRKRLYERMDSRRKDLLLTWREVAGRAGLSYEALRRVQTGQGGLRPLTKRKIEVGLEWPPGTIDQITEGGEPEPVPPVIRDHWDDPDEHTRYAARLIWGLPKLTSEEKAGMMEVILEETGLMDARARVRKRA